MTVLRFVGSIPGPALVLASAALALIMRGWHLWLTRPKDPSVRRLFTAGALAGASLAAAGHLGAITYRSLVSLFSIPSAGCSFGIGFEAVIPGLLVRCR